MVVFPEWGYYFDREMGKEMILCMGYKKGDMDILVCKDIAKSLVVGCFPEWGHGFHRQLDGDMKLCIGK